MVGRFAGARLLFLHVSMALLATVLALGACGSDDDSDSAPDQPAAGAAVLERLAREGDSEVLDRRFTAVLPDDAILFVGLADGVAIAYLCDPQSGSRWMTGAADGGKIELSEDAGARLVGRVDGRRLKARIANAGEHDGDVVLAATPRARLFRQARVPRGRTVGGLVARGNTLRGLFSTTVSTTTLNIGLRATLTAPFDVSIAVRTDTREDRRESRQRAELALAAAERKIDADKAAIERATAEAVGRADAAWAAVTASILTLAVAIVPAIYETPAETDAASSGEALTKEAIDAALAQLNCTELEFRNRFLVAMFTALKRVSICSAVSSSPSKTTTPSIGTVTVSAAS